MKASYSRCLLGISIGMCLSGMVVAQEPLAARLDKIFDEPQWRSARWGIMVKDLTTSEVLYQRDADKVHMPASNMKLYTTAAGLTAMGADYRFETPIYVRGDIDENGVLFGDVIVVGSGDPSISGRYSGRYHTTDRTTTGILEEWGKAIAAHGIKKVVGNVIGDDDIFDERSVDGTWALSYMAEWYAAENSGLAINDNCWDAYVIPDAAGKTVQIGNILDTDYYQFNTSAVSLRPSRGDASTTPTEERGSVSLDRKPETNVIDLSGWVAEDSAPVKEWGSITNGTLFAVTLLKEELERQGIAVTGEAVDIDDMDRDAAARLKADRGAEVHRHVSPPLSEILATINKPSQNFYADMLLKAVGAHVGNRGSWGGGEAVIKDVLTTAGVDASTFRASDGSGLSRFNMVEPRQTVALLEYMRTRDDFGVYLESLPVMGIDGTLKGRMAGTVAEGNVKAKTGTIGSVRALSGYLTAANGHDIAFSMMANNYHVPTSEATEAQNRAVLEIIGK